MSRGLPLSVLLHLVVLSVIAVYGNYVPQPPIPPQRVLRVQIAHLPQVKPQVSQPAETPQDTPPVIPPEDEPRVQTPPAPKLPPKQVPQKPKESTKPEPKQPTRPAPEPKHEPETPPADAGVATAAGPAVSGTDVDFPFAWYLNRVEGIIAAKWSPRQLGFRGNDQRRCIVHFLIDRGGDVNQVTLVQSSGVDLFDREAIRAVRASHLPPLPGKFASPLLGVTFIFTLKQGL